MPEKSHTTPDDHQSGDYEMIKAVCFEICRGQEKDPMGRCGSHVHDLLPMPHMRDRVNKGGNFWWDRWEGYIPTAKSIVDIVRSRMGADLLKDQPQTTKETIPVSEDDLVRWELGADNAFPRLGTFNWPLVVRSLIAKIRSMQNVKE